MRENLNVAWTRLSKWLERNDIFDGKSHRRLALPNIDQSRSIISHSWKLSFPCRSDRKRLHETLASYKGQNISREGIGVRLISNIYYQGDFTPAFTSALKQQIDHLQSGNQKEEWLIAIIQRELEAQAESQAFSGSRAKSTPLKVEPAKIVLYLDDEDCYLELVLPGQSLPIEKTRCLSQKTYCAIKLENKESMEGVIGELDIDPKQEKLFVPECRWKIDEEKDRYEIKIHHQGHDNAVLAEWNCEGLSAIKPYILIDTDTNEIISENTAFGVSLSFLYRSDWNVVTSNGIEAEEPIRISKLKRWRLLLLTKTSSLDSNEAILIKNSKGDKFEIHWGSSENSSFERKPILTGLFQPDKDKTNTLVDLKGYPEVWMPPMEEEASIELFKIEEEEFYTPIKTINIAAAEKWQSAGVSSEINYPGEYLIRVKYCNYNSAKAKKWTKNILIVQPVDAGTLEPKHLQARYRHGASLKVLDLEKDVTPLRLQGSQDFWNAMWQIIGLWSNERIRVNIAADERSHSYSMSADSTGHCEIPIAAFEPYFITKRSARLSIQRHGFIHQYELAFHEEELKKIEVKERYNDSDFSIKQTSRSNKRRRVVDMLELAVYSARGGKNQRKILAKVFKSAIKNEYADQVAASHLYPEGEFAKGDRLVIYRFIFQDISSNLKEDILATAKNAMWHLIESNAGLKIEVEWTQGRENR